MKKLLSRLEQALLEGEDTGLVTIIASSGSTPRGAGARMLVSARGLLAGTIGGGAVEHRCTAMARELLGSVHPVQNSFALNQDDTANLGMICGGRVQVQFLPISGGDERALTLCREAEARFAAGAPFWLFTPLFEGASLNLWPEPRETRTLELSPEQEQGLTPEPKIQTIGGKGWFSEQIQRPGTVYIFGGGHVAQALVPVLVPLDFPCIVVEDREEFADPGLFPGIRETRLVDLNDLNVYGDITSADYVCVMTRGHKNDLLVMQQVLRTPACYIGVIGSARKITTSFENLRGMGFGEKDLARIITPIGLPIGGRSPAEIAISIAAQLIQYRSGLGGKRVVWEDRT